MMHKHWLVLLLMLISLCKCSGPAEEAEPAETIVDLKPTDSVGFSASFSPLEVPISDAVTGWVLDTDSALGIRLMGENILLFSGYGGTKLTLFSGEDLTVSAETMELTVSLEELLHSMNMIAGVVKAEVLAG